jgi:hypothetical protein
MYKKVIKTAGIPLILGVSGAVLLFIAMIINMTGLSSTSSGALADIMYYFDLDDLFSAVSGVSALSAISSIVSYIIYPGIFLTLLLLGMNNARRAAAFGVVWTVFSSLGVVVGVFAIVIVHMVGIFPVSVAVSQYVNLLGNLLVLSSCVYFLVLLDRANIPQAGQLAYGSGIAVNRESNHGAGAGGSITGTSGMYREVSFPINAGEEVLIGRDSALSHIVVDQNADKISRRHCGVKYDASAGMYYVTDYSSNGTFKEDGTRLLANVATPMPKGAIISVGSRQTSFRLN